MWSRWLVLREVRRLASGGLSCLRTAEGGTAVTLPTTLSVYRRPLFAAAGTTGATQEYKGTLASPSFGVLDLERGCARALSTGEGSREAEVADEQGSKGSEEVGDPQQRSGAKKAGRVDSSALLKLDSDDQDLEQRAREKKWPHKIISIRRTAKITKAGVLNSFSAFLIVGNRAGLIGHGKGKSNDAKKAVERAYTNAMSNLIAIELFDGHTIPHDVEHRFKKTKVNLYSGKQGTGVIANELVSTICNLAGIQNLTAKVHGVHHKRNTVRAVFEALELVYTVDEVKRTRGADLRLY